MPRQPDPARLVVPDMLTALRQLAEISQRQSERAQAAPGDLAEVDAKDQAEGDTETVAEIERQHLAAPIRAWRSMKETELQNAICRLADRCGVGWHHFPDSRRVHGLPGAPDLLLLGRDRIAWREVKSQWAELRSTQVHWRNMLKATGQDWAIWRPADLISGLVERELRDLAAGAGTPFAV